MPSLPLNVRAIPASAACTNMAASLLGTAAATLLVALVFTVRATEVFLEGRVLLLQIADLGVVAVVT